MENISFSLILFSLIGCGAAEADTPEQHPHSRFAGLKQNKLGPVVDEFRL